MSPHWSKWKEFLRNVPVKRGENERPAGSNIWTRHSSEQLHKHNHYCLDGGGRWAGAGGRGDYKANLRTDRGHLCPQRTPWIMDPRCANEGRMARFWMAHASGLSYSFLPHVGSYCSLPPCECDRFDSYICELQGSSTSLQGEWEEGEAGMWCSLSRISTPGEVFYNSESSPWR